jgi:cation diffusion facilitator CzcD-associated flavoprotein CzcO
MPKQDHVISPRQKWAFRHVPGLQRMVRAAIYGFTETLQLAQRSPAAMQQVQRIALRHLKRQVADEALRRTLTPKFTLGCKRILLSNTWYPAIQAPNAELVPHAAARVTPDGIVGEDGIERKVDTIIFGTGFFVTNALMFKKVIGRKGVSLDEAWQGSPQAYLGTTCRDFPNAFFMVGPNTGNGHGSALVVIEAQARYVADAVVTAEREGFDAFDVRADAQRAWNDIVQVALSTTVWNSGCASFYLDANGRNSSIYPWTTIDLRHRLRLFDRDAYEVTHARRASAPATEAWASRR